MLKVFHQYSELNIPDLLAVYEEGIIESGRRRFHAEQDLCDYLREDFFAVPGSYYALWCQEDHYVCGLRMEPYRDGYLLSGLETAPRERRKGYGMALVQAVCELTAPIYTHIHRTNLPSLRLHKKCGFVEILDFGVLLDGTVSNRYVTLCYGHKNPTSD